ncbi:hypothetical protein CDA63_03625 [Hymenobacter amundsenii]|uniref:Uncharacterized protein n=1 Tax=Hymenobacter amundsenii TaxID=2006685 RepID=A0A246FNZ3_9BACT|nr:hypothetical protein [Hymenobacter amundsenii]OWP64471.1 hypothetical protein CDA63_03625 [Hymenobacter amundsenii]
MMEMQCGDIVIVTARPAATTKHFYQLKLALQRPDGLGVIRVGLCFYPMVMVFLLARIAAILLLLTSYRLFTNNTLLHKIKERLLDESAALTD